MSEILTVQNTLFVITLMTAVFAVYRSFKQPDIDADKHLAIVDLRLGSLEKTMMTIQTNHLPHIDAKIEALHSDVALLRNVVVEKFSRIETILDERLPPRGV